MSKKSNKKAEESKEKNRIFNHYENLLWVSTSLFVAANAILIATIKDYGFTIPALGLSITIATTYFSLSFKEMADRFRDIEFYKKMKDRKHTQWKAYVFLQGIFAIFWGYHLANKIPELTLKTIMPTYIHSTIYLLIIIIFLLTYYDRQFFK